MFYVNAADSREVTLKILPRKKHLYFYLYFYLTAAVRFFLFIDRRGVKLKEEKLQSKQALVDEIVEKIKAAQSIVLVNYRGLDVAEATELRAKYREAGVDYKVYKNTMMRRAFDECGFEDMAEFLKGPSAIAFSNEDIAAAAKITTEFTKTHQQVEIKAGLVDGKVISASEVDDLAKLPAKEVLIAQVLGGLNAPIQGLVNVLNGNIRGLAVVLKAIAEKKESEAA